MYRFEIENIHNIQFPFFYIDSINKMKGNADMVLKKLRLPGLKI